ncbi:MAG: formate dehydrogenase subunit delta [Gammaproteobacteria bacterium]|jgi:formate dehydrogenase subunit delta|nr:formate dehydrogenase subunit delta [Gammaproteobacteria bacterium]MBU0772601.1 formate dehydrogenase subunit delta [Gammaproteobacteria bacterium]MBU0855201.1 formate dehydrogenase subunit delta [Gammaproteobacteria bacterium]MBU1847391.1 formate dehydrogenase subunit delta [Gammaproteobacteria bacterium]
MDIQNLVKMANQIGQFFSSYADRDEAVREVSAHIRRFWEPRMRAAIIRHMNIGGDTGLMPLVADALRHLQQQETSTA